VNVFRCIWPIHDETIGYADLCHQARAELPDLIAQAHAELLRPGRFSIAPSEWVPGSGRVTESVLVYEAPAKSNGRRLRVVA
jgi:hypothetical protein